MNRRMLLSLPLIALCAGCLNRPAFVPVPSHVFVGFQALREPRTDLPVGALWIDGYGPTGDAATPDNLITTKSLTGVTFDNGFQASLTLGLLKFLDLDPSYSSKMTAHFGDLSVVRVKDFSKLSGPAEQPRIYEALKAGSITITAIGSVGLDIENRAISQNLPAFGRGTSAIAKNFTIDGRDMFIAFEVASSRKIASRDVVTHISLGQTKKVTVGSIDMTLTTKKPSSQSCLTPAVHIVDSPGNRNNPMTGDDLIAGGNMPLHVPISDEQGGLYTAIEVGDVQKVASDICKLAVRVRLTGMRIDRVNPKQPQEF